jgi:MFS transporter, OFA family, oxalate/formate antiporter
VMGFGLGPLLFGPLLEALIGKDASQFASTIPRTFQILALLFLIGIVGAAQLYQLPPAGWQPAGWTPAAGNALRREVPPAQTLRTWQFYALWLLYFLGSAVGITIIGEASPLLQESIRKGGAWLSAGAALGVMSIWNGAGRLFWGLVSDRQGRKAAITGMCVVSSLSCYFLLRNGDSFNTLLAGLCLAASAYGGFLAIMPTWTADYFGPKSLGANYGMLFTAWGACGFFVPGQMAKILDSARAANQLATGYQEVFLLLAALSAAALLVAWPIRPPAD